MHLKIEFQIEVEVFLGPLDLLRMMSGVQNKSPLPSHKEKFLYKTLIYKKMKKFQKKLKRCRDGLPKSIMSEV